MDKEKDKKLENTLDSFLDKKDEKCENGECIIKGDKSIVEVINKKILTEDGRQLLI